MLYINNERSEFIMTFATFLFIMLWYLRLCLPMISMSRLSFTTPCDIFQWVDFFCTCFFSRTDWLLKICIFYPLLVYIDHILWILFVTFSWFHFSWLTVIGFLIYIVKRMGAVLQWVQRYINVSPLLLHYTLFV